MNFVETKLKGAYIIDLKKIEDDRGFFARGWCQNEFKTYNLNPNSAQLNVGFNYKSGTLRGMHFQKHPWAEAKLVRCTKGAVYDVIIDLRRDSPTHGQWIGVELTEENHRMLYAPEGFAHGYQTLADNTEIYYQTTQFYAPEFATGVRFDDPAFGIAWPLPLSMISNQDRTWPAYIG
ncbi:MAG: dTDP-4-dehydrorhamnose 3,5-epimerase [Caldilineaceae bacterium]